MLSIQRLRTPRYVAQFRSPHVGANCLICPYTCIIGRAGIASQPDAYGAAARASSASIILRQEECLRRWSRSVQALPTVTHQAADVDG